MFTFYDYSYFFVLKAYWNKSFIFNGIWKNVTKIDHI